MTTPAIGLTPEQKIKLDDSEKRFRAAELAGRPAEMSLIFNSDELIELRHERDSADAVEYTHAVERELSKRHGGRKPATLAQVYAMRAMCEITNLSREFEMFRRVVEQQVKQLSARVEFAESSAKLAWKGVWKDGVEAKQQELWTDKGGMWCCIVDTRTRPGTSKDWRLAVKNGAGRP